MKCLHLFLHIYLDIAFWKLIAGRSLETNGRKVNNICLFQLGMDNLGKMKASE